MMRGNHLARVSNKAYQNLITNGDFSNGTTDWMSDGSEISAESNVLTNTASGTISYPYIAQNLALPAIIEHVYYMQAKTLVTNANCISISYRIAGKINALTVKTAPEANVSYTIGIVNTAGDTTPMCTVYHMYANLATANGKVMEVQDVIAFDLTATFGAGNEPSQSWCDLYLTPPWIIF